MADPDQPKPPAPKAEPEPPPSPDDIIVEGRRHPLDKPGVSVSTNGVGISGPCPGIDAIGPVHMTCGTGMGMSGPYADVIASFKLGDSGWRAVAQHTTNAQHVSKQMLGVASPPISQLGGSSITVGVDPTKGGVKVGVVRSL
jgi:hypothetical protein